MYSLESNDLNSNLTKLNHLELSFNRIKSLNGLENLTQLTLLKLDSNEIDSLQSLENLTELKSIDLSENKIQLLNGLENLKQKQQQLLQKVVLLIKIYIYLIKKNKK